MLLMSVEQLAKRFVASASKEKLSKVEQEEARRLMRQLKEAGMSSEEISKLSKGKWTQSTVKGYAQGVRATDPGQWQDTVSLLGDLICTGMTLDDVKTAVTIFENLDSHGISLDQVVGLLLAAGSASMDVTALIQQHEVLNQLALSPHDVAEALALREELDKAGFDADSLKPLAELARNYGEPQKTIEAVSAYKSLQEIHGQIAMANGELEDLNEQLASMRHELEGIEGSLSQLKQPLEAYEKALMLGFSEIELEELSKLTSKYGGVKKVLEAVAAHTSYAEVTNKISGAKEVLGGTKAKIDKLETEYGHLKTATAMCSSLMREYKFGLDAIITVFSVAKKYGDPVDVLKAIECYGKLQAAQQELGKLEGKIGESRQHLAQLEGRRDEMLNELESLNALALKVGAEVGAVQSQLQHSKGLEKMMSLMNDPASASYNEFCPLVLAVAASLLKWVDTHGQRFTYPYNTKSGLQSLIKELGGA